MQFRRTTFVAALGILTTASFSFAQEKRGTWEGQAYVNNSGQPLTVVLDSGATGWKGSAVSSQVGEVKLVEIAVVADTVSFGIPYEGMVVYISGLVAADKFSGGIWVQNQSVGTIELTRKKPAGDAPKPPEGIERIATLGYRAVQLPLYVE